MTTTNEQTEMNRIGTIDQTNGTTATTSYKKQEPKETKSINM